ncbi:hypothetical protein DFH09DRAFT_1173331 [Mycena vulgaris]|nr:hypothetical protein DFH09DRAFT_1173331 [Mycena vulgaris]
MDAATRARMASMLLSGGGRPLSELMKTKETLKGAESQRLRTFCTSNTMEPGRDMDAYAMLLAAGDVDAVRADFERRVARRKASGTVAPAGRSTDAAAPLGPEAAAAQEIYALCWGPTLLTIYHILLHFRVLFPEKAAGYLAIARFLAETARVPVDGADLSGTHALSVAISTKPIVDFEYAQILHDAGGDVNNRNRYGGTAAHEIIQVWTPTDKSVMGRAVRALAWFLGHGGNVDIADGDGMRARAMAARLERFSPDLANLIAGVDRARKAHVATCCGFCGREDKVHLKCGKCKAVRYCPPSARACQKLDWPHHKKGCAAGAVGAESGFSFLGTKFKP